MKRKKLMEKGMQGVFFISALASIIAVALICIFMFARGVPAIAEWLVDKLHSAKFALRNFITG